MNEATGILRALAQGESQAAGQLLPLVYDQLRCLAAHRLAEQAAGQTLQPTALVHEAFLRLVEKGDRQNWQNRGHFFAAAAEAMRRILVENARRKGRLKRGGQHQRLDFLQLEQVVAADPADELLELDEALDLLAQEDPSKAELIKLRFFAGLSLEDSAHCLGISRATANRHLAYARAWLYDRLSTRDEG